MSENQETEHPDVSFAEVAAEDPQESVAHEGESVDTILELAPEQADEPGEESDNDVVPEEPASASLLGPGPVSPGDEATI